MSHYDAYGPGFYDAKWDEKVPREHDYFAWAAKQIKKLGDGPILDAGCGDGEHIKTLHASGIDTRRLVGVDFSPKAVEAYKARGCRAGLVPIEKLPFCDGAFPIVLALEVLEHLEDPLVGWEELKRVCSVGIVITVPPMMDIPQHKTVLDASGWGKLLGINRAPDWKGLQQIGWVHRVGDPA